MPFLTISNKNISCKTKGSRTKMSRASPDFIFFFFFFLTFSEGCTLIRKNPKGIKFITAILYLDMSGLKLISLGSELL